MTVAPAHILWLMVCILAFAREFPEEMTALGEAFLAIWVCRRFLR